MPTSPMLTNPRLTGDVKLSRRDLGALTLAATLLAPLSNTARATGTGKLTAGDIQAWADDVFSKALAEHRFSGLNFAVTQGGDILFMKGYGYQDMATSVPMDPRRTQTRIASLTKTFMAISLAILMERGKIDSLDDPVNKYLKRAQLPQNNGEDITIWDLLTHRGGFANTRSVPNDMAHTFPVPAAVIKASMPDYARPRNTVSVYSNFGSSLLGYMSEDISRQTLNEFLKANVYGPLGMTNTEVGLSAEPPPNMITQYAFVPGGPAVKLPYPTITLVTPYAGSMLSTAEDMSKWIIANIQEGAPGTPSAKVMKPESWTRMHSRHRGNSAATSGFGMTFFTYDYNGERVIEHYGSLQHYTLELMCMDSKVGIYVTFAGGGEPGKGVENPAASAGPKTVGPVKARMSHTGARALIFDHFLGRLPFDRNMKVDLTPYTGRYRDIPRAPDPLQPPREIAVTDSGDGGLVIAGRGVYRPSGPNLFVLDHPIDLEAGFEDANMFEFTTDAQGMKLFGHVNAGGYEKIAGA
jgi:CubicO group peptidase (beta-lactamase class C family)